jgi:transcriptional regulator with XRE-family HTH domain
VHGLELPGHNRARQLHGGALASAVMQAQRELGAFLRARRDDVRPDSVGLPAATSRRVPGLRREEVASLADVSVDYLRRVEQGSVVPSDAVLDALAGGLGLGRIERTHLQDLADRARGRQQPPAGDSAARPSLLRTLEALAPTPAVVLGRRCEVVAWNPTGAALDQVVAALPAKQRNVARRVVLDPSARELYPELPALVAEVADVLQRNAARFPDDAELAALVEQLLEGSAEFRGCWERRDVFEKSSGRKVLNHPDVGRLELTYETFDVSGAPGQQLLVYTAEPNSPTADRLARLATG